MTRYRVTHTEGKTNLLIKSGRNLSFISTIHMNIYYFCGKSFNSTYQEDEILKLTWFGDIISNLLHESLHGQNHFEICCQKC